MAKEKSKMGSYLQALLVKSKEALRLCSGHRAACQGSAWCGKLSSGPSESPNRKVRWKAELCILRSCGEQGPGRRPPSCHCFLEKENPSFRLSPSHRINMPSGQGDGGLPVLGAGSGIV